MQIILSSSKVRLPRPMASRAEKSIAAVNESEMLQPIYLCHTPSPKPLNNAAASRSESASESSLTTKQKRAARACDVCRNHHRKCPGPAPGSDSCDRCIKQHKVCTWNEHQNRVARQAARSATPQTPKRVKISIRRSRSTPSPLPSDSTLSPPLSDEAGPSASSPLSSSDEDQEPATPIEGQPHLPFSTNHHVGPTQGNGAFMQQRPQAPSVPPQEDSQQQPAQAEVLPEWYTDCLAVANKHDLLLFPMPLESWEDRQLRGDGASQFDVGLRCIVPSYVDPPPTKREAVNMLGLLLLEMRTFPDADQAETPAVNSAFFPQSEVEAASSSDGEPDLPVPVTETYSIGGTGGMDPFSSYPPLPAQTEGQSIDIILDDKDASSEIEPNFSFDFDFDSSKSSLFETAPLRPTAVHDRFDPFLFSPRTCHVTPHPQQPTTSPMTTANETSDEIQVKDERSSWDECMPDVIDDASLDVTLDDWLHIDQMNMLE